MYFPLLNSPILPPRSPPPSSSSLVCCRKSSSCSNVRRALLGYSLLLFVASLLVLVISSQHANFLFGAPSSLSPSHGGASRMLAYTRRFRHSRNGLRPAAAVPRRRGVWSRQSPRSYGGGAPSYSPFSSFFPSFFASASTLGMPPHEGTSSRSFCQVAKVPAGYEVLKTEEIEEYAAKATLLKHQKTGAEILSMEKDDDNKVFSIAFRTPVEDSKGIPHILEHSVLCGSRSYPTKSPFIELRKSSLHTFLNAMTFADRTVYPVASQNNQDFYNLADVYLDSVLHPRAKDDPLVLAQEGWHYELKDVKDPLTIKGVVYNEMKGVYSSPDSLHGRLTVRALFPDVPYAEDSGGDPEAIPTLDYKQFRSFHDRYYHPSNARVFFYGNDPVEKRFALLDKYLNEFEPLAEGSSHSAVGTQPLKKEPYRLHQSVPVAKGQEEKKHMATLGWVVSEEPLSEEEDLAWSLIDQLLTGNTAARLRKTLTDSGLGSSVIGGGLASYLKQPYYTIGLKGLSSKESGEEMERLVLSTLTKVVEEGFDQEALEAALNRVEFSLREFDTASTQRGMSFLFGAMSEWNYDRDPVKGFKFEDTLAAVKKSVKNDPMYLRNIIKRRLLDNTHRALVTSSPDSTLEEKKESKLSALLKQKKEQMSEKQLEEVVEITRSLTERQATPDSPGAVATIPRLTRDDLDKKTKHIPRDLSTIHGAALLKHEQATNGILYMDYVLDISGLKPELLPLLNLFTRIASGATGTAEKDRVALRHAIDRHTGGISCSWGSSTPITRGEDGSCVVAAPDSVGVRLYMHGKCVAAKSEEMTALFHEMLYSSRLDDKERIIQMLKESKSGLESSFVSRGNGYATRRLAANRHVPGLISEMTGGVEYYTHVCSMLDLAQNDFSKLQGKLQEIRDYIARARQADATINLTADKKTLASVNDNVSDFVLGVGLKEGGVAASPSIAESLSTRLKTGQKVSNEGVVIPTQVNYVGFGGRMYKEGERVAGSTAVVTNFLRTGYLWDKIRVMGGAYGAGISLNARMGTFAFSSYRDPNVRESVENYKKAAEFLIEAAIPEEEVERAIIGTVSDLDYPQTPGGKGSTSLSRYFTGYNEGDAQRWRDEVLATTVEDFREFGRRLKAALDDTSSAPSICAFGSKSGLMNAVDEGLDMTLVDAFTNKPLKEEE